jgi:hypothetical protein
MPEGLTFGKEFFTETVHYKHNPREGWRPIAWRSSHRGLLMKSIWSYANKVQPGETYGIELVMYPDMISEHEVLMVVLVSASRSGGAFIRVYLKGFPGCTHKKDTVRSDLRSLYERLKTFENSQRVSRRVKQGYPIDLRYYPLDKSFSCLLETTKVIL